MKSFSTHRRIVFTILFSIYMFAIFAQEIHVFTVDSLSNKTKRKEIPHIEYNFSPRQLILPASLISVGVVGTALDGMNDFHLFSRKDRSKKIWIDDYLEWGMLGWVFACDLIGKEKHSFVDQLFLVAMSESINAVMIRPIKKTLNEPRPDTGGCSFPSGHTSNAFLGAHMAYKEFKDTNPWLAYSGYGVAAFVGFCRVYNNRHWVTDVVGGAGFGILSVELAYLAYFPLRNAIAKKINQKKMENLVIVPSFNPYGGNLSLVYRF